MNLKLATEADWEWVKAIRLEALQSEPSVFGSSYARESLYDEAQWRAWSAGQGKAIFLLYDGKSLIGLTGVLAHRDDPTTAMCIASYLKPAYRGQKLSRLFYQTRLDWARGQGFTRLVVGHRASNLPSMHANQAFGFQETHREPHTWHDGTEEQEIYYELLLPGYIGGG
ncbi:MAG: GNAT family N-acetyltransferase [Armatimonadetes bacterium]|nr:GNAT family N-acetyltransferase [Armatimonadota bacterium]